MRRVATPLAAAKIDVPSLACLAGDSAACVASSARRASSARTRLANDGLERHGSHYRMAREVHLAVRPLACVLALALPGARARHQSGGIGNRGVDLHVLRVELSG